VSSGFPQQFINAFRSWWREQSLEKGPAATTFLLVRNFWTFLRDSTPSRRRQRYGDMDYDWEHRVNTTSGTVSWRERLLGVFHSPYQPTDPALFHEMMASLALLSEEFAFNTFTFVDLGSGKGRTLLMASEYPFRRIVGVELLPALHGIAQENLGRYKSESQKCFDLEAVCGDAIDFAFPVEPLVIFLFNPLPEAGLRRVVANLDASLKAHPRAVYVLYHNPLLDWVVCESTVLVRIGGTEQYSIYSANTTGQYPRNDTTKMLSVEIK
jgi:SAM-dependent methyltransferase